MNACEELPMGSAVLLLSGGLDSTVCLAAACREGKVTLALTFDYGQRAAEREVNAAKRIAQAYGVRHDVVRLPWLQSITTSALVRSDQKLPESQTADIKARREAAERVWVPNRNGVFLNIAAAYAEAMGCEQVVAGFNREEGEVFPDNTADFMKATSAAFRFSTRGKVRLESPTAGLGKKEIFALGLELGAPLGSIWSCYSEGPAMCGKCSSCFGLVRAARAHGFDDINNLPTKR